MERFHQSGRLQTKMLARYFAILKTLLRGTDHAAYPAVITRSGDRRTIQLGNGGRNSIGLGKGILYLLQLVDTHQISQGVTGLYTFPHFIPAFYRVVLVAHDDNVYV